MNDDERHLMERDVRIQENLSWLQTRSGRKVSFLNPQADDIDPDDIAWALSMQCRFAGHGRKFYSIAEHSCLVACAVPVQDALYGLLHDAAEAYVTDIPKGLKNQVPQFSVVEERFHRAICDRFGLSFYAIPPAVKEVDLRILLNEKELLFPGNEITWPLNVEKLPDVFPVGLAQVDAFNWFRNLLRILIRRQR